MSRSAAIREQVGAPLECGPVLGRRLILEADPAAVAALPQSLEQGREVRLARAGLVAAGCVSNLHVGDCVAVRQEQFGWIRSSSRGVICVEEDADPLWCVGARAQRDG